MQRDAFAAVFDGSFDCVTEATAAGHGHPCDGDGPDIVVLKNLRQLLGVIHRIQLGTADHGHAILHKIVMEIAVGISGAVGSDQQVCSIKIGGVGGAAA